MCEGGGWWQGIEGPGIEWPGIKGGGRGWQGIEWPSIEWVILQSLHKY